MTSRELSAHFVCYIVVPSIFMLLKIRHMEFTQGLSSVRYREVLRACGRHRSTANPLFVQHFVNNKTTPRYFPHDLLIPPTDGQNVESVSMPWRHRQWWMFNLGGQWHLVPIETSNRWMRGHMYTLTNVHLWSFETTMRVFNIHWTMVVFSPTVFSNQLLWKEPMVFWLKLEKWSFFLTL